MDIYLKENDSLNKALEKANSGDTIYLYNKVYREKVKITTSDLKIIGTGSSTISYKDYYNKIGDDNKELLTVRTYTLMVAADNVLLKNIIIKNESVPNSIYGQAVALHVLGDNFKCEGCKIYGAQDTILAGPIPYDLTLRYKNLIPDDEKTQKKSHQLYQNCYIEGDVDFIFGAGICFFTGCQINSIGKGYICAPAHPKEYSIGFVFSDCELTSQNTKDNSVYLARPWRDYGNATFINCKASSHICKEGFHNWTKEREGTCKMAIYNTLLDTSSLVKFAKTLKKEDLLNYSLDKVMNN